MSIELMRTIVLGVGWPVLIAGSVYLFIRGRHVYRLVKGATIGRVSKTLVFTMLVEMYSLGAVSTALMFCDDNGVYLVVPVFVVWAIVFVQSLRTLGAAQKEIEALTK